MTKLQIGHDVCSEDQEAALANPIEFPHCGSWRVVYQLNFTRTEWQEEPQEQHQASTRHAALRELRSTLQVSCSCHGSHGPIAKQRSRRGG